MPQCTIHILDEVNCRIDGLRPEHLKTLWEKFGIYVDGYMHTPQFQLRKWDGKNRYFKPDGVTYTKILGEIVPYLGSWNYEINLVDKRLPAPVITDRIDENVFNLANFALRPYQVNVVNILLEAGCGLAICATGAGKTSLVGALGMVLFLNGLQTLVIVPSSDLVTQTVDEIREKLTEYPISVGEYSGTAKDIDHPIVVATWQALQNVPHYLSYFQAVVVDECHGARGAVIQKLLNESGKHISHRYGVTGTLPKSETDRMSIKCALGVPLVEVPARWLIDQGYLSEVEIQPVETHDVADLPDYSSERTFLASCAERLDVLAAMIQQARDEHGNTLVLVNSITQGRELQELIPGSVFLSGESKKGLRKENYNQFADRDDVIVIATAGIAATGISIDRIFALVLIDSGKSFVRAIQSIGRSLRKKGDKSKAFVYDVYSKLKFSKKHARDRQKYYKEAEYAVLPTKKLRYLKN